MLEMGQPMHAFDINSIEGKHITVRRAKKGEKITNETVEQDFNDAKKEVQQGVDNVTKNVKKADEEFQKEIDKVLNKKGK